MDVLLYTLTITFLSAIQVVMTQDGQVMCQNSTRCTENFQFKTIEDCCENRTGIAYVIPGVEGCFLCPIVFGFGQASFRGKERSADYTVEVGFTSGGSGDMMTFELKTNFISAKTSDFLLKSPTTLTFPPNMAIMFPVKFAFVQDSLAQEFNETVVLSLVSTGLNPPFRNGAVFRDKIELVIEDADEISFMLSDFEFSATEGPNATIPVRITSTVGIHLENPITLSVTPLTITQAVAQGVTAINFTDNPNSPVRANTDDYDSTVLNIIFPANEFEPFPLNTLPANIMVVDDKIDEADEQFFIAYLDVVSAINFGLIRTDERNTSICIIEDNDPIQIIFEFMTYNFLEPNSLEEIRNQVFLIKENNRISERTFGLNIIVGDPSGSIPPATLQSATNLINFDYSIGHTIGMTSVVMEMPPSFQNISFNFFLNADGVAEGSEAFQLIVTDTDGFPSIFPNIAKSPRTQIVIIDNDDAQVGFEQLQYTASESSSRIQICVRVTNPPAQEALNFDISLLYETRPRSVDGMLTRGSLQFRAAPGLPTSQNRTMCFNIDIMDDNVREEDGLFGVILALDQSIPQPRVIVNPDTTHIIILDNDDVFIGFLSRTYRANEVDGEVILEVGIITGSQQDDIIITILITLTNGTASLGSDYGSISSTIDITIGPASIPLSLHIPLINDGVFEDTERFRASLAITGSVPRVSISVATTNIIISDDDVLEFSFVPSLVEVSESIGLATLTVSLVSGSLEDGITVVLMASTDDDSAGTTATAGLDYTSVSSTILQFTSGTSSQSISINIIPDDLREEKEIIEAVLVAGSVLTNDGIPFPSDRIQAISNLGQIAILDDDNGNIEVNDTIIADPLFTVPILVSDKQLGALNIDRLSLCYEINGQPETWFNLVTDECTSINAHFKCIAKQLNVINKIGVRAVDRNNQCVNIQVDVDQCTATVGKVNLHQMAQYSLGGINVKKYKNRVRISVPNCADITLVVWVICEREDLFNPDGTGSTLTIHMIKFVVMRGLNFGHRNAHGFLGQFWNIPVSVEPFSGLERGGTISKNRLRVDLTTNNKPRSFTGKLLPYNWASDQEPCLFVGNRQSGPIYAILDPNDGVIEGSFKDYKVKSAFSEKGYVFGLFDEDRCTEGSASGSHLY